MKPPIITKFSPFLKAAVCSCSTKQTLLKNSQNLQENINRGVRNFRFFGKFDVLCFLVTPILRFAIVPYYRRNVSINSSNRDCQNVLHFLFVHQFAINHLSSGINNSKGSIFCLLHQVSRKIKIIVTGSHIHKIKLILNA